MEKKTLFNWLRLRRSSGAIAPIRQEAALESVSHTQDLNSKISCISTKNLIQSSTILSLTSGAVCHEVTENGKTYTGTRLYKRRFWMLFNYCICSMLNSCQFTAFSIISGTTECYYSVDAYAVNWTSSVFYVVYLILVLPSSWFIDRYTLKVNVLIASACNVLHSVSRCFALGRNGFPMIMVAQTFVAIGDVFVLPLPPKLSSVWFGASEVCRATSIGVYGNALGMAIGFLLPPLLVPNDCSEPELVRDGFSAMAYGFTAVNLLNFLLLLTTFEAEPPTPPSETSKTEIPESYVESLKNLLKNVNFQWLLATYGLLAGYIMALESLLNQMLAPIYKDAEVEIGWMGLSVIATGSVGVWASGYVLDKTHKFKAVTLFVCIGGLVSMAIFTGFLYLRSLVLQFIITAIIGFFMSINYPPGFEFAVELTYPEPGGFSAVLMNSSTMVYGCALTFLGSYILQNYGILAICLFFFASIVVATITCALITPELKRTERNMQAMIAKKENRRQELSLQLENKHQEMILKQENKHPELVYFGQKSENCEK